MLTLFPATQSCCKTFKGHIFDPFSHLDFPLLTLNAGVALLIPQQLRKTEHLSLCLKPPANYRTIELMPFWTFAGRFSRWRQHLPRVWPRSDSAETHFTVWKHLRETGTFKVWSALDLKVLEELKHHFALNLLTRNKCDPPKNTQQPKYVLTGVLTQLLDYHVTPVSTDRCWATIIIRNKENNN